MVRVRVVGIGFSSRDSWMGRGIGGEVIGLRGVEELSVVP